MTVITSTRSKTNQTLFSRSALLSMMFPD